MPPAQPVVAIIQARTGSTRLPGKVLLPLGDEPLLARVVGRAGQARDVDRVVVATTTLAADDPIEHLRQRGWTVFRGSEEDLLDRYVQAARAAGAATVVRITSDCPLIDSEVVDTVIEAFLADGADYASNVLAPRTWPLGLETEVVRADVLEAAWRDDDDPAWREHATPFIYRHPERFRLLRVPFPVDLTRHRWCIDTAEDYELVSRLWDELGQGDSAGATCSRSSEDTRTGPTSTAPSRNACRTRKRGLGDRARSDRPRPR